jgi:acetyl esterase/lipase
LTEDVTTHEEAWSQTDEGPLLVRIYRPASAAGALPAILDVHGGAWSSSDRLADELYNRALAAAGFVVAAIDFHQGPTHQHPSASRDVVSALVWLREHADRLAIDGDRIGLLGSSSGGHLVMYAGLTPNAQHHRGSREEPVRPPRFIMALWPPSDPFFRYRYAKRAGIERLVDAHDGFYGNEEAMRAASVPRLVTAGEAESLPPLLIVQPGEDGNVPVEMTYELMRAWQSRGGYLEYSFFPDQPHGFGHVESPETERMVDLLVDFARRHSRVWS